MNKVTRASFSILKFSAVGFILLYITIIVMVGAAGHGSGDYVSFFYITAFSGTTFFIIHDYEKRLVSGKKIKLIHKLLFLLLLFSTIGVAIILTVGLLSQGIGIGIAGITLIPLLYVFSGFFVLRHLFKSSTPA